MLIIDQSRSRAKNWKKINYWNQMRVIISRYVWRTKPKVGVTVTQVTRCQTTECQDRKNEIEKIGCVIANNQFSLPIFLTENTKSFLVLAFRFCQVGSIRVKLVYCSIKLPVKEVEYSKWMRCMTLIRYHCKNSFL